VSEETGKVSVAMAGDLEQDLSRDRLEKILRENLGAIMAPSVSDSTVLGG